MNHKFLVAYVNGDVETIEAPCADDAVLMARKVPIMDIRQMWRNWFLDLSCSALRFDYCRSDN